jgi:hypothetical protein
MSRKVKMEPNLITWKAMDRVMLPCIFGIKRTVSIGSEYDTHRILVFMICINVLHIYDLLSVSGKLAANRAISAAPATA